MRELTRVCVYCGSADGARPAYRAMAERLGDLLVEEGIELVFGGGRVGLMGAIADRVMARGGRATGVIPQALVDLEVAHAGLTDLRVVRSMHERKKLMADLSDAFIALPGGVGTLEEVVEVLTWSQLRFMDKPVALLDVEGYWAPLEAFLDRGVAEGFVRPANRGLLLRATDPERLLADLRSWERPA